MKFKAASYLGGERGYGEFTIYTCGHIWNAFWWGESVLQEKEMFDYEKETGESLFETHMFETLKEAKQWCKEHLKKIKQIVTKAE